MNRLLDRMKTSALALFCGAMVVALAGDTALQTIAQHHNVTFHDVTGFMQTYPMAMWPSDLRMAVYVSLVIGLVIAITLFCWMRNLRWSPCDHDLRSEDAAEELLKKGVAHYKVRAAKNKTDVSQYKARTLKDNRQTIESDNCTQEHNSDTNQGGIIQSPHSEVRHKDKLALWVGKYAGKNFHVSEEDRALVIGPPGTGKTAFLLNQVLRATQQGLSFVIVDFKPELYDLLADTLDSVGYQILRVSPAKADTTTDCWNPLADIGDDDETALSELAASLLPIADPGDAPFKESQRDWLKLAFLHAKTQPGGSLISAFNWLSSTSDPSQLLSALEKSSSAAVARLARRLLAGLAGSKPDPLIISGYSGCLRSIDWLGLAPVQSALGHSDFSVRDLGKKVQPAALFLQFEEVKAEALGPLFSFLIMGVLKVLIDTAGQRAPVALYLDELGNMPGIQGLPERLNTIRSRKIPTYMFFQTAAQMEKRYGRGAAELFFASSDLQIFFRLNDQDTRELVSKLIGTYEREKISVSANGSTAATRTKSRERINVIEPHQLGQLKSGEVVALYRGAAAVGRATPHYVDFPQFRRQ